MKHHSPEWHSEPFCNPPEMYPLLYGSRSAATPQWIQSPKQPRDQNNELVPSDKMRDIDGYQMETLTTKSEKVSFSYQSISMFIEDFRKTIVLLDVN